MRGVFGYLGVQVFGAFLDSLYKLLTNGSIPEYLNSYKERIEPMKSIFSFAAQTLALAVLACGLLTARTDAQKTTEKASMNPRLEMTVESPDKKTSKIVIELLPKVAPKTVAHFLALTNKKFYDGILFHRYEAGFVIQGGDPKSKGVDGSKLRNITSGEAGQQYQLGMGGSGETVPLEGGAKHERGTLGLARSQDPNSGDSQFFFNLKANDFLNDNYCVFGKVVTGLDAMDALRQGDKIVSLRVLKPAAKK